MDIHDLRGVMTGLILLTFIGLFVWVWRGRRDRFDDAANLPFADEDERRGNPEDDGTADAAARRGEDADRENGRQ